MILSRKQGGVPGHRVGEHALVGVHVLRARMTTAHDFAGLGLRLEGRTGSRGRSLRFPPLETTSPSGSGSEDPIRFRKAMKPNRRPRNRSPTLSLEPAYLREDICWRVIGG